MKRMRGIRVARAPTDVVEQARGPPDRQRARMAYHEGREIECVRARLNESALSYPQRLLTRARAADGQPMLRSARANSKDGKKPPVGFEPTTSRLLSGCSAN